MRKLTPEGENAVADIANRHGASIDAVKTLLEALANGGGTMAQFSHPELGGSGQWLRGGMVMVGDMFNNALKAKVDGICSELSSLLDQGRLNAAPQSFQSQSQSSGGGGGMNSGVSVFFEQSSGNYGNWWPSDLGHPAATGAQNSVRYAYFPDTRRLAIDNNGTVEVSDTQDHAIQGFGQQQGGGASISFNSQYGLVRLDGLRRVSGAAGADSHAQAAPQSQAAPQAEFQPQPQPQPQQGGYAPSGHGNSDDIFAALERLGALKEKGILTEEEFSSKKAELLKRL
jgi:hypothetical protein